MTYNYKKHAKPFTEVKGNQGVVLPDIKVKKVTSKITVTEA